MTTPFHILAIILVVGGATVTSPIASHAEGVNHRTTSRCQMAGGEAVMVTQGLAEFMAKAALGHAIENQGGKPAGPIVMHCDAPVPLTHCEAKQKVCS